MKPIYEQMDGTYVLAEAVNNIRNAAEEIA